MSQHAYPTRGNPIAGEAAALLCASQLWKLATASGADVGRELELDLAAGTLESTRLLRNPSCRAPHERWDLVPVDDVPLERLALGAAPGLRKAAAPGERQLAFPGRVFVERADCPVCGHEERWRLVFAHDARLEPCPACDAPRRVTGFAQRERVRLDALPSGWLERTPSQLGLQAGDVIEFGSGDARVHCELAPGGARVGSEQSHNELSAAALFGVGNTGSALAAKLARTPGLERVLVCDPDRFARGQQRTQAITAGDVGRPKVEVARETILRIAPALDVQAFEMRLEQMPLGLLRGCVVISALDGVIARMRLAELARRLGSLFVDMGVAGGASLLARVSVFAPGDDDACFECSLDSDAAIDDRWPCDAAHEALRPTSRLEDSP